MERRGKAALPGVPSRGTRGNGVHSLFFVFLTAQLSAWNLTSLDFLNPPNHELLDIEISSNFALIPGGIGGLSIVDISDPGILRTVASYYASGCDIGRLYAWHVSGDLAFGSGRRCGIKVLDISAKESPVEVSQYGREGFSYEHSVAKGSRLYAAVHGDGVEVIDISDPYRPVPLRRISTGNAWAVAIKDTLLLVADGANGLGVIHISDGAGVPEFFGFSEASGTAKDVAVNGDYAFVAVGAAGVDLFDLSNPREPVLVANYNTSGYASRVAVSDSLVAVSDWDDVEILQWDNSPALRLVGYKKTGGRVMAIEMVGDVVFSAEWGLLKSFRFGPVDGADLDASFRNLDFPYTPPGSCSDTSIYLVNSGTERLIIHDVSVSSPDFSVDFPRGDLGPGESMVGTITYCPSDGGGNATVAISSNDSDESIVDITVEGNSLFGVEAGRPAPDFGLPSVNGFGEITLSDLRGRVVVIAFFASW